ncbi:anti-sigma factor RsbA family regulatory protein [Microbispora sp. NPDC049125]|uniref:anti-sigma factor RsbA family regulatory protein n=1 Tax=Microbispora sp. NPDC049125 TaxID=3154929 RepID=UPI0034677B44
MTTPDRLEGSLQHVGLLYRDDDEYAEGCGAFLDRALAVGGPVLVAVPGRGGEVIRALVGGRSSAVTFVDMAVAGRNPGRIIPGLLLPFLRDHTGHPAWIVAEPLWKGRGDMEYAACAAQEALINVALAGDEATVLCPYDASRLHTQAVVDAHRTHPVMRDTAGTRDSPAYTDPLETAAAFDVPLPRPPSGAATCCFDGVRALPSVRDFAGARAAEAGLAPLRVSELAIAVNELATNTVEHTRGPGRLTVWTEHDVFVCQIDDTGRIRDPLAGLVPPPDTATHGRGLVVVHELADLVRLHRHASGTSVRVHFDLPRGRAGD